MLSRIPWGARIFALIWLAVALIWPLREPFFIRVAQDKSTYGIPYLPVPSPTPPQTDDVIGQSEQLFEQFRSDRNPAVLQQWDELAAQHPKEVWIRADRLRITTIEGVLNASSPLKWMTPQVVNATIACAREGQKIEPDNGFWGWMEAVFALKAGRNAEALSALQQAASASRWDDYNQDHVRREIALTERNGPMLYELKVMRHSFQLYPHVSQFRLVANAITKQGLTLLSQGNKKAAFKLFNTVLGAARNLRKDSTSSIVGQVGASIERNVWHQVAVSQGVKLKGNDYDWKDPNWKKSLEVFGRLAREAGYPQLANLAPLEFQAAIEDERSTSFPLDEHFEENFSRTFLGVSALTLKIGIQGAYLITYVALLAFAGALLWACGKLWSPTTSIGPIRGEIVRSANFTFWALICSLALLWYLKIGSAFITTMGDIYGAQNPLFKSREIATTSFPAFALLAWLFPIAWSTTRHYKHQPKLKTRATISKEKITSVKNSAKFSPLLTLRLLLRIFLVIFCVMSFGSGSDLWDDTIFAFPIPLFASGFCALASLTIEIYLWRKGESRFNIPHPLALAFATATLSATYFFVTSSPLSLMWLLPLLAVVGFLLTLWPRPQMDEVNASPLQFFIAGATHSAGILAVAWSLFYLLGISVIWPMRAQMNHQITHMMSVGERPWRAQQTK